MNAARSIESMPVAADVRNQCVYSASRRADHAASEDFMARNGIWVHLAVIKRRRCKEPSVATPSWVSDRHLLSRGNLR